MGGFFILLIYLLHMVIAGIAVKEVSVAINSTLNQVDFNLEFATPFSIGQTCNIRELPSDAIHAINRATSRSCKQEIEQIACTINRGGYYPDYIQNTCPMGLDPARDYEHKDWDGSTMRPARIFYLLQLHGRAVQQILRLFRLIYHPVHFYYLHVDVNSDYLHTALLPLQIKYDNVFVTNNRFRTMWGGVTLLEMVLSVMTEALWDIKWEWDYFMNLSGADFPLRTNQELTRLLGANMGENFLKPSSTDLDTFIKKQGISHTFVQCDNHMWKLGPRKLPDGVIFEGGSDWISLHRDFVEYVISADDIIVRELEVFYRHTLLPVESFFHTVLRNGIYCHTFVKESLRLIHWNHRLGCNCQYKHIVDWCGCSPNNLRVDQLRKLIDQPEYLVFARKFESIVDNTVINMLESHLTSQQPQLSNLYTESVYDRDFSPEFTPKVLLVLNTLFDIYHNKNQCNTSNDVITEVYTVRNEKRLGLIIQTNHMQIFYTYINPIIFFDHEATPERFKEVIVGTGLDKKERIFRNYHDILTILDSPEVLLNWEQGSQLVISIDWYSPSQELISHFVTKLKSTWSVVFHTPDWVKPLEPGIWRVDIGSNNVHFISVKVAIFSSEIGEENLKMLANEKFDFKEDCYFGYQNNCKITKKCKKTVWSNKANDVLKVL
ncbi:Xylosyltransferase 1-like [Oopsacas minuta]|uniref:protein xylosyltransferase n=1 Tax=Oopsacas minuta TaxID=111878 RepID=A0AAV7KGG5_9METZ|nr:Xylosyltransferase 1-like [Oopsacas minuta]